MAFCHLTFLSSGVVSLYRLWWSSWWRCVSSSNVCTSSCSLPSNFTMSSSFWDFSWIRASCSSAISYEHQMKTCRLTHFFLTIENPVCSPTLRWISDSLYQSYEIFNYLYNHGESKLVCWTSVWSKIWILQDALPIICMDPPEVVLLTSRCCSSSPFWADMCSSLACSELRSCWSFWVSDWDSITLWVSSSPDRAVSCRTTSQRSNNTLPVIHHLLH